MEAVINTMQRMEKKYILTQEQYISIMEKIHEYIEEDVYPQSQIYNLYLDTEDYQLIRRSIEKPAYKEKLRIRSYEELDQENQDVFLEVKKKYQQIVSKRRMEVRYDRLLKNLKDKEYDSVDTQIAKELSYALRLYKVQPKVFIAYDRLSFKGSKETELRLTFDFHIRSRFQHLNLQDHKDNKELFQNSECLMEIKAAHVYPMWLVSILSKHKLYPVSFSKVGIIYKQQYEQGGDVQCSQVS